jgi:hypothetical protein
MTGAEQEKKTTVMRICSDIRTGFEKMVPRENVKMRKEDNFIGW